MKESPEPKKVLTKTAYKVLMPLRELQFIKDFYLAGGTGLALNIGHRISIDFDFFTTKNELSLQHQNKILQELTQGAKFIIDSQEEGSLKVRIDDTLVSFFYYPYPLVGSTIKISSVDVASLEDIALMKVAAIIGRGSKKDFIDLYFIIRDCLALRHILKLGEKKFKDVRDFHIQALKALVYFDDAEKERMPRMIKKASWKEIKEFIAHIVSEEMRGKL